MCRNSLENTIGGYRGAFINGAGIGIDWQRSDFDVKRVFHASSSYELPYGEGRSFGSNAHGIQQAALGGWMLNVIATLQDGQPFTIGCPTATGAGTGCNANLVSGVNPFANSSVTHFVNAAAFLNPPLVAAIGQSDLAPLGSRGSQLTGPAFRRLDASIFKRFNFGPRIYSEFRLEVFNTTNTANFANPSSLNFLNTPPSARLQQRETRPAIPARFNWRPSCIGDLMPKARKKRVSMDPRRIRERLSSVIGTSQFHLRPVYSNCSARRCKRARAPILFGAVLDSYLR